MADVEYNTSSFPSHKVLQWVLETERLKEPEVYGTRQW